MLRPVAPGFAFPCPASWIPSKTPWMISMQAGRSGFSSSTPKEASFTRANKGRGGLSPEKPNAPSANLFPRPDGKLSAQQTSHWETVQRLAWRALFGVLITRVLAGVRVLPILSKQIPNL